MSSAEQLSVSTTIDENQVELAVKALFAHIENTPKPKKQLFPEKEIFWLTLAWKNIPAPSLRPYVIPLPHTVNENVEVCLFTASTGKETKAYLEEQGVTVISKVISIDKLKKEYNAFSTRRDLCAAYDIFLCDAKIFSRMPKCLGKIFYSKKKQPLSVRLQGDVKGQIDRTLSSTRMPVGQGPCSAIKVGTSNLTEQQIIDNIMKVAKFIAEEGPRGWGNVKALYLKTATSVSLPIYNSAPEYEGNSDEEKASEEKEDAKHTKKTRKRNRPLTDKAVEEEKQGKKVQKKTIVKVKPKKMRRKETKPILKKIGVR